MLYRENTLLIYKIDLSLQLMSFTLMFYLKIIIWMPYNHFRNIFRLFDVLPNFLSPQVKRHAIITCKHGMYELPEVLLNDFMMTIKFFIK